MNRAFAATTSANTAQYILWYWKAFLTGQIGGATTGLWAIVGSSDSVTGGLDGVDRWTSTFTVGKIVRAANGTAHSWVCLKSPSILGRFYYLLIDWNTASDYLVTVTLGADTVPTTSQGANFFQYGPVIPNSTNSSLASQGFSLSASFGNIKVHGQLATDGSFNFFASRDNTSQFFSVFNFQLLANYKAGDNFPCWLYLVNDGTIAHGIGYLANPFTGPDNGANAVARSPDNVTGIVNPGAICPVTTYVPSNPDSFDGSYVDWPLWLGTKDTNTRCIKGRLVDIMYFGGGATTGAVDNPSGSPSYMVVNNFWFPTNAAPSL